MQLDLFLPCHKFSPFGKCLSPKQQGLINDFFLTIIFFISSQEIPPCKSSTLPLPVASEHILLQDI